MKYLNIFFKKRKKTYLHEVLTYLNIKNKKTYKNVLINNIQNLDQANKNDITFFHSSKYKDLLKVTKSNFIITTSQLSHLLPKLKSKLIVDNVLISVAKITEFFYPNSLNDQFENKYINIDKKNIYKNVKFGSNVVLGENVKIGKNSTVGHNSIIESNVRIGNDCIIGSNVIIKKTLIGNNVSILDGAIIGKKGFGFFPNKNKNIRYPHIGMVVIGNNVEVGCNNTIDRGSLSNTIIGNNSFLDNQVHIAHNVKIGKNCIITGQVGFAGSSTIGNNVMIGGQAGISGHLKIGNNVKIGGGSGVIKNIPDNTKVMGYPAKNIKKFVMENK
jgi:UDP-3-O-[3-hydroxymyristoyl] glucosamine N-acyltransferase